MYLLPKTKSWDLSIGEGLEPIVGTGTTGVDPAAEVAPADKTAGETLYPEVKTEAEPKVEPEVKTEDPAPEGDTEKKAEEGKEEVPALELKLPENFEIDEAAMASFKDLAAKAGLDSEKAQGLFDLYAAQVAKLVEAPVKAWESTISTWKSEVEKDPELGGEKTKTVQLAIGRALDEFGSKEAREAFELTGAGWNPHIIRTFYRMATALSEGTMATGGRPSVVGGKSLGNILYPSKEA